MSKHQILFLPYFPLSDPFPIEGTKWVVWPYFKCKDKSVSDISVRNRLDKIFSIYREPYDLKPDDLPPKK